jgi:shikimate kinase
MTTAPTRKSRRPLRDGWKQANYPIKDGYPAYRWADYAKDCAIFGLAMQNHVDAPPHAVPVSPLVAALGGRAIALVGMMGAGKSSIGRKLAHTLGLRFVDADTEIERAAGMTIAEIFARHGEAYFRSGEARVLSRLLHDGAQILATGGGAYMNAATRAELRAQAVTVWLKADFDVLVRRLRRRTDRPMLHTADPEQTLRDLIALRDPVYAEADVTILSRDVPHDHITSEIIARVSHHLGLPAPEGKDCK